MPERREGSGRVEETGRGAAVNGDGFGVDGGAEGENGEDVTRVEREKEANESVGRETEQTKLKRVSW